MCKNYNEKKNNFALSNAKNVLTYSYNSLTKNNLNKNFKFANKLFL